MEKLDKLPEYIKKQILYELPINKICEFLKETKNFTTKLVKTNPYREWEIIDPFKSIFSFRYYPPNGKNIFEQQFQFEVINFNFFDCLELIQTQQNEIDEQQFCLSYKEGDLIICQFGNKFEIGRIISINSNDEYIVNFGFGQSNAKIHARQIRKIENVQNLYEIL